MNNPIAKISDRVRRSNSPVDHFFSNLFGDNLSVWTGDRWPSQSRSAYTFEPAVDVHETDNAFEIEAEAPGMNKDDFKLSLEGNTLTFSGVKRTESEEKKESYHRVERSYGSFTRSFSLPDSVDREKVMADYKDGVLKITLPKLEPRRPKKIDVKVS